MVGMRGEVDSARRMAATASGAHNSGMGQSIEDEAVVHAPELLDRLAAVGGHIGARGESLQPADRDLTTLSSATSMRGGRPSGGFLSAMRPPGERFGTPIGQSPLNTWKSCDWCTGLPGKGRPGSLLNNQDRASLQSR
jgi:hypothetical protein